MVIANITYYNLQLKTERSIAFTNRLLACIEQLDDYDQMESLVVKVIDGVVVKLKGM